MALGQVKRGAAAEAAGAAGPSVAKDFKQFLLANFELMQREQQLEQRPSPGLVSASATGSPGRQEPRTLRLEVQGLCYDWFKIDDVSTQEAMRMPDFANTLRDNIAWHFNVPAECQAIYGEESLLRTTAEFEGALQGDYPLLTVFDIRDLTPARKEQMARSWLGQRMEASVEEPAVPPRTLSVEFKGQAFEWLNLDEHPELDQEDNAEFMLRENIEHYWEIPLDCILLYDESGQPVTNSLELARALKKARPYLRIEDSREAEIIVDEGAVFAAWDTNRDGVIDRNEFKQAQVLLTSAALPSGSVICSPSPRTSPGSNTLEAFRPNSSSSPLPQRPASFGGYTPVSPAVRPLGVGSLRSPRSWSSAGLPAATFEVDLEREPPGFGSTGGFGFAVADDQEHSVLVVSWISDSGQLSRWNSINPSRVLRENDVILRVNGIEGASQALRTELMTKSAVRITALRGSP